MEFIEGRRAYRNGKSLSDNPYDQSDRRRRWADGWKAEKIAQNRAFS